MADVTQILSQIDQGNSHAAEQLLPLVYDELRKLAAARLAQIPVILSEDFNDGGRIEGVQFANPFDPAFDVTRL